MKFTKIFLFTLLAIFSLSFIANTTNVAQAEKAKGIVDVTVVANVTPSLTTTAVSSITTTTASSGGDITSDGGASVTARGVAWSTSANPTIADSKTSDGTGTGLFTSSITGLTAGTTYYVRAYATNSVGTAYGNEVSFTTSAAVAIPPTPTSPSATISSACGTTSGTISWTASTGATTYVIYRSTDNSSYTVLTPNVSASPKTDSGLTAGQIYYYKIAAANGSGESAATAAVSYTVPAACAEVGVPSLSTTAVSSITGTTASSGGNTITDGGASITAKGVVWGISSGPTTALATKTSNGTGTANFSSSITGLTAGTKYYVRAYATNSVGTAYGNEVSFTTSVAIPPTPTSPSATISSTSCGTTSGTISWTASTGATTYVIYKSTNNSSYTVLTPNVSAPTVSKTDSGLTAGQKYYYKIAAANGSGESAGTSAVSFTVPAACADAEPTCYDGIENQDETGVDIGGVCGTCSDGIENGNETSADIGGRCAKGTLTISPTSCTIAENASTCPVNATWTTSKVALPVSLIDANVPKTLSTFANRSTAFEVWVAFPQTVFKLKDYDNNTLDTRGIRAMCADGTNWDFINKICKNNSPTPPNLTTSASSPTTATVDVAQTYTATITNSGTVAMGKTSHYFWQVASLANGGGTISNKTSSTLANLVAGGKATATLNNTFTSVGTYSMRACADFTSPGAGGVITESSEDDNCGPTTNSGWTNVTVDVATPPNLTTSASSPTTATVDVAQTYTATITNSGTVAMGKTSHYFWQVASLANGGGTISNKTSSTLANLVAGGKATATLNNTFTSVGTYSMRACADFTSPGAGGVITESSEDDNCGPTTNSGWTNVTVTTPNCSDGIKNQDETSIDMGGVCDTSPGIDPIVADCKVVSDTTNLVVSSGKFAVATWMHTYWTASIPGATWIWRTFKVEHPESDEIETFTKTFYLTSTSSIAAAQLITAADNAYTASINGTQVIDQWGERNSLSSNMQERYIKSYLNLGANTLSFTVKNLASTGVYATPEGNPAGLLYRLSITDSSGVNNNCDTFTPPDPSLPPADITSFTIKSNGTSALSPNTIRYNTRVNIAWTSSDATSCACTSADTKGIQGLTCGDTVNDSPGSFQTLSLKKSMIFTLSCLNGDGVSTSESKTVTVDDINTIYKEN